MYQSTKCKICDGTTEEHECRCGWELSKTECEDGAGMCQGCLFIVSSSY